MADSRKVLPEANAPTKLEALALVSPPSGLSNAAGIATSGDWRALTSVCINGITFTNKEKIGCLLIDPRTTRHAKWDTWVALLLVYTAYVTPYEVAFNSTRLNPMFYVNLVVNISFFLDLLKSFFTAIQDSESELWVGDWDTILGNYLKGWFLIDLISILPFDSAGLLMNNDELAKFKAARIIRLLRLLKLLRLLRSMRIFARYQDKFGITHAVKTLIKFVLLILTAVHWMACILRLLPDMMPATEVGGAPISWMTSSTLTGQEIAEASPARQYNVALYWATMTLTTIGYGDVSATNDTEAVWMTISMIFASFVYAYTIGEVCGIVATMDEPSREFNKQSDLLNNFCSENDIPKLLTVRLRAYFRNYKQVHRMNFYRGLLSQMSPTLRGEISVQLNSVLAESISFFNPKDKDERVRFLSAITTAMQTKLYAGQEDVIRVGSRMQGLYLVRSGICCGGKSGQVFSSGSWFGVEGLLLEGKYQYSVRTLNMLCTELVLKAGLNNILDGGDYPQTAALIRKAKVKLVFKMNVARFIQLITPEQLSAARRGSVVSATLTAEQHVRIKYGDISNAEMKKREAEFVESRANEETRRANVSLPDVLKAVMDLTEMAAKSDVAVSQLTKSVAEIKRRLDTADENHHSYTPSTTRSGLQHSLRFNPPLLLNGTLPELEG
jgi:potassium voltage-gated channel Eag-related subfamily H protein 7